MKINQLYTILNEASKEAMGEQAITTKDTSGIVALGQTLLNSANSNLLDVWMNKLVDRIGKTVIVNRTRKKTDLGISKDEFEFGAILQKIKMKPIELEHNTEYDLNNTAPFNPFEVKTPEIDQKFYSNFGTISAKVFVPDEQIKSAFLDESGMLRLFALIFKQLDDAFDRGMENYDRLALCTWIAEKIKLGNDSNQIDAGKIHLVYPLKDYNREENKTLTPKQALKDAGFLRYFSQTMDKWIGNMENETDVFNGSDGYVTTTSRDYLKFYLLKNVDSALRYNLYGDTFHNEYEKLDGFREVNFWQGPGVNKFAFDDVSKIDIDTPDGTNVKQSNIVSVLMDMDGLCTNYYRTKSESWRYFTKGNVYYRAFTSQIMLDTDENGIVFILDDEDSLNVSADIDETVKTSIEETFNLDVDTNQSVEIDNDMITATLKYQSSVDTFDMTKGNHFIVLTFSDDSASTIRTKLNPTQGTGWKTLDSDGTFIAQVNENTKGIYVETTDNVGNTSTTYYRLNLTLLANT